jgi:hypothetical protein
MPCCADVDFLGEVLFHRFFEHFFLVKMGSDKKLGVYKILEFFLRFFIFLLKIYKTKNIFGKNFSSKIFF